MANSAIYGFCLSYDLTSYIRTPLILATTRKSRLLSKKYYYACIKTTSTGIRKHELINSKRSSLYVVNPKEKTKMITFVKTIPISINI